MGADQPSKSIRSEKWVAVKTMKTAPTLSLRNQLINILDNEDGRDNGWYSYTNIVIIILSILTLVAELRFTSTYKEYFEYFTIFEIFALIFFSIDFCARIILYTRRSKYLVSFYGIIDLLTVGIGIISLVFPILAGSSVLRVFRVFRFARLLKLRHGTSVFKGISGIALPYVISAMAFKLAVLAIEVLPWYPEVSGISIIVSVIGFILAILLGTKLNIANVRLHSVEDSICRIVGALKILDKYDTVKSELIAWSKEFEVSLINVANRRRAAEEMRIRTDKLLITLHSHSISGPNVATFARDVSYVLHRSNAKPNKTYEDFLKYVIFAYTIVVIILVPNFIGVVASGLITYVLVGIYLLIDDLDSAFQSEEGTSFFVADITPLTFYNQTTGK